MFLKLILLLSASHVLASVGPPCGKGTYTVSAGTCAYCPAGTYNDQSSSTPPGSCTQAQTGHYACGPQGLCTGATSQSDCGSGYYQNLQSQSSCNICPAGSFCPGQNSVNPQLCSPGKYSPNTGLGDNDCMSCPKGTYNNVNGATACCQCCPGTYNDQFAQTHCQDCITNPYSAPGETSSTCKATSQGYVTDKTCDTSANTSGRGLGSGTCPVYTIPSNLPRKRRSMSCPKGLTKCAVYFGTGGFDCVDTNTDPENCGGCTSPDDSTTDCTAIPHVNISVCNKGRCAIKSCMKGYRLNSDGTECESINAILLKQMNAHRRRSAKHGTSA